MIELTASPLTVIRRHVADAFPEECCGVLGGSATNGGKRVEAAIPLSNASTESLPTRYFAPAEEIRRAEAELKARGLEVVGFYHSHPNAPAQPSAYDLAQATWPWLSYVIVSAQDGEARELKSWVLADDRSRFLPENVELAGHPAES